MIVIGAGQQSNSYSDAANHDAHHPDKHMGEEDEDKDIDEDTAEYKPHVTGSEPRINRGNMRFCRRTRVTRLSSDDQRLIAYSKMNMEWKEIFKRFPDRTPGAVRTRSHTLQRR